MKNFVFICLFSALLLFSFSDINAQETDEKVIDEVVAQVNDGVITLSRVKREMKAIVESDVQNGKDRAEAQKIVDGKLGDLIAGLVNEELLNQRAKEIGLEQEIEASLNERFLGIMKQYNLKTLDALYQEMEKTGVNPKDLRDMWRKQATIDAVLRQEVSSKVYFEATPKELKAYFEKNKAMFTKPETVSLSEIFLAFAGRDENAVREKAKQLVAELRGGADFAKIAVENSDRPDVATSKGKVDTINVKELDPIFANAITNLKAGDVSDPVESDTTGISIVRVDERTKATSESVYDEHAIRRAILAEKGPDAQKKFMATLRKDAYIKISNEYRPIVSPILFAQERQDTPAEK